MFLDTLSPDARSLLQRLAGESLNERFYLAGGSAVALHLGHRISVDLDFFTQDSFDPALLLHCLGSLGRLSVRQQGQGTLVGDLKGVKVGFLSYPYPLLADLDAALGTRVAALLDLALMKIIAIAQRGTKRDFLDLYFICQHGWRLRDLLERIPQKYRVTSYPSYHLLRALTYFADAEGDEMPAMRIGADWNDVRRFFEEEVRELMEEV